MTKHESLMLFRHLTNAARHYEQMRANIATDCPTAEHRAAMKFYEEQCVEALDLSEKLRGATT